MMKIFRLQLHALPFLLIAVTAFYVLIGGVNCHEDPSEAVKRQRLFIRAWFRDKYRQLYTLKDHYPRPIRPELLRYYPQPILNLVDDLTHFGTLSWNPTDDVLAMLRRLEGETKALLVNSLHPNLIESQSETVRNQHYETRKKLAEWIHEHFDQIADLEGYDAAADRLQSYRDLRDLASIATSIPPF